MATRSPTTRTRSVKGRTVALSASPFTPTLVDTVAPANKVCTRPEAEAIADLMPDEYLQCRTWQHRWVSWSASWSDHEHTYQAIQRCDRCLGERTQSISQTGQLLKTSRAYPPGYLSAPGTGRVVGEAKDAFRLALVTRTINGTTVRGERKAPKRSRRAA